MLAVLEYREGKCETAVGHFEKTGPLLDSELDALHAYGTCLVRLKRLDEATAVFQRAVALRPDDARERRLLASIQLMASKPHDAIATLSPILEGRRGRCGDAGARGQRLRGCRRHRARREHAASGDPPRIRGIQTCTWILRTSPSRTSRSRSVSTWSPTASVCSRRPRRCTSPAACCTCSWPSTTRQKPTSRRPTSWTRASR